MFCGVGSLMQEVGSDSSTGLNCMLNDAAATCALAKTSGLHLLKMHTAQ